MFRSMGGKGGSENVRKWLRDMLAGGAVGGRVNGSVGVWSDSVMFRVLSMWSPVLFGYNSDGIIVLLSGGSELMSLTSMVGS